MRKFLIYCLFIGLLTGFISDDLWNFIEEKTWLSTNSFAGEQLIFYKTRNGLKKAIRQVHGSGVYIMRSVIYDVEIKADTVHFRDGRDLQDGRETEDYYVIYNPKDSVLATNNNVLRYKIIHSSPILYNWQGNFRAGEKLSIETLKKLPLEKKTIYKKGTFKRAEN